jgi:hypothetical protein
VSESERWDFLFKSIINKGPIVICMTKRKDYKTLLVIARKIIPKKTIKKIRSIGDKEEKFDLLKYLIKARMEMMLHELDKRINKLKMEKKDTLIIELKTDLLISKIKYFNASNEKKDGKIVFQMFKTIDKEVKKIV